MSSRISLFLIWVGLGGLSWVLSLHWQGSKKPPPAERSVRTLALHPENNAGEREEGFSYPFDQRTNALIRIIFPPTLYPAGHSRAYVDRARSMEFSSKDAALQYHAASINAAAAVPQAHEKAREATESFWLSAHASDGRAQQLFQDAPTIELLARGIAKDQSKATNLLEKALWQRDLICSLQAILHCQAIERDQSRTPAWEGAKDALLGCLAQAVFTETEYDDLHALLPQAPSAAHFASRCRYVLTEDYLPPVVCAPSANWQELPSDEAPGLHFQAYGGRSFIRIFMMIPGMSASEFFDYWAKVTRRFGMNVTVSAAVPSLPAGTQTVLLRTFGVFLADGSYADSRIPEEVLVRVFKYREATLDPDTSDGLGTLHYQYKLRRDRLLDDAATLGLRRIQDADSQFYGFFAEVPDPHASEHLTTMRANCISCHSELLYGASTIFSLCRRSPAKSEPSLIEGGRAEKIGPKCWRIKQETLHTIQKELTSRLKTGRPAIAKRIPP